MRHNSAVLDTFAKVVQGWTTMAHEMPSSQSTTCWICLNGLEHSLRNLGFRPTSSYLIIKLLATQVKLVEPSSYCTRIIFTFSIRNDFVMWHSDIVGSISSRIGWGCTFICMAFKSHMEWSKALVSEPIKIMLSARVSTYLWLNCFNHMKYVPLIKT